MKFISLLRSSNIYCIYSLASVSLKNGFRPATLTQYTRMWKDFLAFLVAAGLSLHQVTPLVLLAYMQYLINATLSESNISNNLAAIRDFHNTWPPHISISGSSDPSSLKIHQNQQAFCSKNCSVPHN